MAPFVPDGVYKIRSIGFNGQVVELADGIPDGPIVGTKDSVGNPEQMWRIKNYGFGGNQITIENVASPGNFATATQVQGAGLVGASETTIWTVVKVDKGYYLQSPDANYVWQLPSGDDYVEIVIVHHTAQDNTKWVFIKQ